MNNKYNMVIPTYLLPTFSPNFNVLVKKKFALLINILPALLKIFRGPCVFDYFIILVHLNIFFYYSILMNLINLIDLIKLVKWWHFPCRKVSTLETLTKKCQHINKDI